MMAGDHHQRLTTTWCGLIKPTNGGVSSPVPMPYIIAAHRPQTLGFWTVHGATESKDS